MAGFDYSHGHPDGLWGQPSLLPLGFREHFPRRPVSLELYMFNSVTCCSMVISCTKVSQYQPKYAETRGAGIAQSVWRLGTGWTFGDRIPLGVRFSAPIQTCPEGHPASYTMGTGSFPPVRRPGRGVDHPPPSSAEVEGRVELYICSPSGPTWPVLGRALP